MASMKRIQDFAQIKRTVRNTRTEEQRIFPRDFRNVQWEKDNLIQRLKMLITKFIRASSKLSKAPPPASDIAEISEVVCKIIFMTPATEKAETVVLSNLLSPFFYLSKELNALGKDDLANVVFKAFLEKLRNRFMLKKRLQDLLKGRQMPPEKKEKWLQRQYEVQEKRLKETDVRSIVFLTMLLAKGPDFFYQTLQCLLKQADDERAIFEFIDAVLKKVNQSRSPFYREAHGENKEVQELYQTIKQFADSNHSLPTSTKILLTEHWDLYFGPSPCGQIRARRLIPVLN